MCDEAEARGEVVDRLGDGEANSADHNRRHSGVLNKTYDMMLAVAIGQVVKGDKEDRDRMAARNEGTVTDLLELEGDESFHPGVGRENKVMCLRSLFKEGLKPLR